MTVSNPRRVHHIDVVVRDLDQAEDRYRRVLGIDPLPRETLPERAIDLVRFRIGETWLILVQPTSSAGPVAAFLDEHGEGFFHMAIEFEDVESQARDVEARGVRLANNSPRIGIDGWKLIDVELTETLGAMIQFVEAPEER